MSCCADCGHRPCSTPSWPVRVMRLAGSGESRPTSRSTGSPESCRARPKPCEQRSAVKARVYVLIRNTAEETVIGGQRAAVDAVVKALRCPFVELPTVSTVHCEIARTVETEYHALHDLTTTAPAGIEFYSGAWGRPYPVDRQSAADAITAQALETIDFPALIERAYDDGIRFFLEVGPGSSCTRLIGQILRGRPHVAISACRPDRDPLAAILDVLAELDHAPLARRPRRPLRSFRETPHRARGRRHARENERRHKVRVDVTRWCVQGSRAARAPSDIPGRDRFQYATETRRDARFARRSVERRIDVRCSGSVRRRAGDTRAG